MNISTTHANQSRPTSFTSIDADQSRHESNRKCREVSVYQLKLGTILGSTSVWRRVPLVQTETESWTPRTTPIRPLVMARGERMLSLSGWGQTKTNIEIRFNYTWPDSRRSNTLQRFTVQWVGETTEYGVRARNSEQTLFQGTPCECGSVSNQGFGSPQVLSIHPLLKACLWVPFVQLQSGE